MPVREGASDLERERKMKKRKIDDAFKLWIDDYLTNAQKQVRTYTYVCVWHVCACARNDIMRSYTYVCVCVYVCVCKA